MTRPDLDVLESLLAKATPGPWDTDSDDLGLWVNSYTNPCPIAKMGSSTTLPQKENAALIVAAVNALPALIAHVRELERDRDQSTLNRACADALVSAAQDMTQAAALAMRERCAVACEALKVNRPSDPLANAFDGACETCAAAVRALEP